jgi:hypothetical protein
LESLDLAISTPRNKLTRAKGRDDWSDPYTQKRLASLKLFFLAYKSKGQYSRIQASYDSTILMTVGSRIYNARLIRKWASEYVSTGELLPYRQGSHSKRVSLIDCAGVKEACLVYLRAVQCESKVNPLVRISVSDFAEYVL